MRKQMTDRERAVLAIRRGVPLGEVVKCSCHTTRITMNTFAIETLMLLPYVYWLKLLQAHQEFVEDLTAHA